MRRFSSCVLVILATLMSLSAVARAGNPIIDKVMKEQAGRIPRPAMEKAFGYFESHADEIKNKNYVTIVDFNLPSNEMRMHVINMQTGKVEDILVAHGKNSGTISATDFSNTPGSLKSSLGICLSAEEYVGKHGLSMRLDGMEPTNSNIRSRDIVLHGATYVSKEYIAKNGRLGRSEGCLAVPQDQVERLVKLLAGKSVILVYRDASPDVQKNKDAKPESDKSKD